LNSAENFLFSFFIYTPEVYYTKFIPSKVSFQLRHYKTAVNEILNTYREIDNFYINLLNTPEKQRIFKDYSNSINTIESEISVMVLKNSARPLNTESTKIAKNILVSWRKHKILFQKDNSYSDVDISLDRETFFDNFVILLNAEQAKPISD
jgi:sRNA-binding regulator protein Hfq